MFTLRNVVTIICTLLILLGCYVSGMDMWPTIGAGIITAGVAYVLAPSPDELISNSELADRHRKQIEDQAIDDFQLTPPPSENDPQDTHMRDRSTRQKLYDTTRFTKSQFDRIVEVNAQRKAQNKANGYTTKHPDYVTIHDITKQLNEEFNLNKSRQSYSDVWCGKVRRDSLEQN